MEADQADRGRMKSRRAWISQLQSHDTHQVTESTTLHVVFRNTQTAWCADDDDDEDDALLPLTLTRVVSF